MLHSFFKYATESGRLRRKESLNRSIETRIARISRTLTTDGHRWTRMVKTDLNRRKQRRKEAPPGLTAHIHTPISGRRNLAGLVVLDSCGNDLPMKIAYKYTAMILMSLA